jgi:hypothetical protein
VTPHCWEWQARAEINGYGTFTVRSGVQRLVHRLAYEIHAGEPPPKGLVVRHRCDNPKCVNPDHLELGTHAENMRDKVSRGRQVRGERSPSAKLTEDQVREIRSAPEGQGRTLARKFGISNTQVSKIKNGHAWQHVA